MPLRYIPFEDGHFEIDDQSIDINIVKVEWKKSTSNILLA